MKNFKDLLEYALLLTEDRIDFLKQQFKDRLPVDHDELAKHTASDDIVNHFATKADPTPNKTHTQWLLNQYRSKNIRQEDAPQLKSTLQDFEKTKNNLEKKDINQYSNVGELRDAVATQKAPVEQQIKAKKEAAERKVGDMPKLYDQDGVQGFKIPNKEASISNYGPNGKMASTSWCTAANSAQNMFNHYKGGKYTMHFPNNEVLQFHHQSNQIKDKHDVEINEGDPRFKDYEHHIGNFIKQTEEDEPNSRISKRFHSYTPEEVEKHISKYEGYANANPSNSYNLYHRELSGVASKAKLTDEQIERIKNTNAPKHDLEETHPADYLAGNSNLSKEHVDKIAEEAHSSPKKYSLYANLSKNTNLSGEHLDKVFDHYMGEVGTSEPIMNLLRNNPHLSEKHIDSVFSKKPAAATELIKNNGIALNKKHEDKFIDVASENNDHNKLAHLANRKQLHPDTIEKLIDKKHVSVNDALIKNRDISLSDGHIKKIISNNNMKNLVDLFNSDHENMSANREEVVNKLIENAKNNPKYNYLGLLANSKHLTNEHVNRMIAAGDEAPDSKESIYENISKHRKLDASQITKLLSKPDYTSYLSNLLKNNKLKADHLHKVLDDGVFDENHEDILQHPSANNEVIGKLFDKSNHITRSHILHSPKAQLSHFNKSMELGAPMHGAISSSPSAPPSILDKLAESPLSFVRHNVAKNKNTSNETYAKLLNDSLPEIAALAKKKHKGK